MKYSYASISALLFVTVAATPIRAQPQSASQETLPLFVLAGQSNMVGVSAKANVAALPKELQAAQANVLFLEFWAKKFQPIEPGKNPRNRIGPEVSFGLAASQQLKSKVGLIKLASGGTSLSGPWNPTKYDKEKHIGTLYKRLTDYVKKVRQANPETRVVGMLWMQGEADSRYGKVTMEEYRDNLEALIDGCRREFDNEQMYFVAGRVNPPGWPNQQAVRQAIETVRRKNYAWVNCDTLELGKDRLHFTVNGQVALGNRFADKLRELMSQGQETPSSGK